MTCSGARKFHGYRKGRTPLGVRVRRGKPANKKRVKASDMTKLIKSDQRTPVGQKPKKAAFYIYFKYKRLLAYD